jgi:RNA-directed DNA polymerase
MVAWQYSYGRILRKLLKAGVLDSNHFTPGEIGVPQGGVLSPCLANACLDGLEKALGSIKRIFVRYADDFIITGNSQEQLEQAKKVVTDFASRGLCINLDKTKITKVAQGFDFLGFIPWQRAKGKNKGIFLVKPSKDNVTNITRKISEVVKAYPNAEAGTIIKNLNPILRGWAEHYRTVSSRDAFRKVSEHTFRSFVG